MFGAVSLFLIYCLCSQNVSGNLQSAPVYEDETPIRSDLPARILLTDQEDPENNELPVSVPLPLNCSYESGACQAIPENVTDYLKLLGVNLEYNNTSCTKDVSEILRLVQSGERLKFHRNCWNYAQPLLFAVIMPKCVNGQICQIPKTYCNDFKKYCGNSAIEALPDSLHELKNCDENDIDLFPTNDEKCGTSWFDSLRTNIAYSCPFPTKKTDNELKFIKVFGMPNYNETPIGNSGCGVQCRNPFFPEDQQTSLHIYIAVMVALSILFNSVAFISLALRWRTLNKYPDTCLLYINVCFLMADIGWVIQFVPGARERIACAEDGTMRIREPQPGEAFSLCLITFILVYYFIFAAGIWFISMTYCWYRSFHSLYINQVKAKGFLKNYSVRFHLLAWITPALMASIVILTSGIDGNSISGICFIGMEWGLVRGFLLVMPLIIIAGLSGLFMIRGVIILYRIRKKNDQNLSILDMQNIRSTMLHIGVIVALICICMLVSVFIHAHYYINQNRYSELRDVFLDCHFGAAIANNDTTSCHPNETIDFETIEFGFHIGLQFLAGIIFSTWVFRQSPVKKWAKTVRRKVTVEVLAVKQRISVTTPPHPQTGNGNVNATFIPDDPSVAIPIQSTNPTGGYFETPQTPTSVNLSENIVMVLLKNPVQEQVDDRLGNWQQRATEVRRELRNKSLPTANFATGIINHQKESLDTTIDEKVKSPPNDDRLSNWKERALEIRMEMRKKSSTGNILGTARRVGSSDILTNILAIDSSIGTDVKNPDAKRQRRYGRVEQFEQSSQVESAGIPQTSHSGGQFQEVPGEQEYTSFVNGFTKEPKKSILKNPTDILARASPDEGIESRPGTSLDDRVENAENSEELLK